MYRDLGFVRVWGGESGADSVEFMARDLRGVAYAYLVYPHKPIVAYLPQTRQLLQRVLRRVPRRDAALRLRAPAGLRRRPRQVDGAQGRRAAADLRGQHAPARPPGRSQAGPARPLAARPLGARAPRAHAARIPAAAPARRQPPLGSAHDRRRRRRQRPPGPQAQLARAHRGPRARPGARLPQGHRLRRRGARRGPIIGVASTWIETMPCNFHLRALAAKVKDGVRAAGGTPMEFNTIAISDGITMGTERHEDEPGQPRGHRRLDRARRPRAPVRRRSSPSRAATRRSPAP